MTHKHPEMFLKVQNYFLSCLWSILEIYLELRGITHTLFTLETMHDGAKDSVFGVNTVLAGMYILKKK